MAQRDFPKTPKSREPKKDPCERECVRASRAQHEHRNGRTGSENERRCSQDRSVRRTLGEGG